MNSIIDLAVAYWRLEKWVANAPVEKKMAANSSLRTMKRFLDANGIEIRDLTGQAFDYGMNLKVIHSDMPENDPTAKPIISEMIKPMVLQNGSVVSAGEVVIGTVVKSAPIMVNQTSSDQTTQEDSAKSSSPEDKIAAEKKNFWERWRSVIVPSAFAAMALTFGVIFSVNLAELGKSTWRMEDKINAEKTFTVCLAYEDGGDIISKKEYSFGEKILIPEEITNRPADDTFTYTLSGWNEKPNFAYKDMIYLASYSTEYIDYSVSFLDFDGRIISEATYHCGDLIVVPELPSRSSDETYNYACVGWDKTVSEMCRGNATYKAQYQADYIDYTVKFLNYDDSILSEGKYHYGATINVPNNPVKPSDDTYSYVFVGWDSEVSTTCLGDATYKAQFQADYIDYTITFMNEDSSIISQKTYHFGAPIDVPASPTKDSDEMYDYEFAGWYPEVSPTCDGTKTYKAKFNSILKA